MMKLTMMMTVNWDEMLPGAILTSLPSEVSTIGSSTSPFIMLSLNAFTLISRPPAMYQLPPMVILDNVTFVVNLNWTGEKKTKIKSLNLVNPYTNSVNSTWNSKKAEYHQDTHAEMNVFDWLVSCHQRVRNRLSHYHLLCIYCPCMLQKHGSMIEIQGIHICGLPDQKHVSRCG